MTTINARMFLGCVAIWGTTWIAITFQLGETAPEWSVAMRFGAAAAILAGFCRIRGYPLRFSWPVQFHLAGMGLSMFTAAYLCVYYAEMHVVSALVAVGYCASPLINQWFSWLALRRPVSRRVTVGGLIGFAGIATIYYPELSTLHVSRDVAVGGLLTTGAVIASAVGNVLSSVLEKYRLNVWQKMTMSMAWGAAGCVLIGLARGHPFALHLDWTFLLSLIYLALLGSVLAFAMYLTLLESIGAGKAGYIGVMVPVVALALSSLFEGYVLTPLAILGVALAIAGNVIILVPARDIQK